MVFIWVGYWGIIRDYLDFSLLVDVEVIWKVIRGIGIDEKMFISILIERLNV